MPSGRITPQTLKGFRDFLPEDMLLRQKIAEIMRQVFERFGYDPIENPALEYAKILQGKAGREEKLGYYFKDRGGREVGLRFEQTIPLARFVAQYQDKLPFPFKRYQLQKVWRADKPQRGRYREFYQFDFDIVGPNTRLADAEVGQILYQTMIELGFKDFYIRLNNRKILKAYAEYLGEPAERMASLYRAVDKLKKIGPEAVKKELENSGFDEQIINKISLTILRSNKSANENLLEQLKNSFKNIPIALEGVKETKTVLDLLKTAGVDEKYFHVDPAMVRGLDYYTGIIFEVEVVEGGIGSVGGGGRYDELLGILAKKEIAATGIGWGFERLVDIIKERKMIVIPKTSAQVLVTIFSPELLEKSTKLANQLRAGGINTEIYLDPEKDLRKQLEYANKKGIPYSIILGSQEIETGQVTVKNMKTGQQTTINTSEIPKTIAR